MKGWQLAVGIIFVAVGVGGVLYQLQDARVLEALKRSRHRPRPVIIVAIELLLLLAVAYLSTNTARWAAVVWTVVGWLLALVLIWTSRNILRMPAPDLASAEPRPAEPAASAQHAPTKQSYMWVGDPPPYIWVIEPPSASFRRFHGVPITDGAPEPRAYCGYEYDRGEIGSGFAWTPQNWSALYTCKICRAVLVKAGYVPF